MDTVIGQLRAAVAAVDPAQLTVEDRLALLDLLQAAHNAEVAPPPDCIGVVQF